MLPAVGTCFLSLGDSPTVLLLREMDLVLILPLVLLSLDVPRTQSIVGETALQKSKHCVEAAREAYQLLADGGDASADQLH